LEELMNYDLAVFDPAAAPRNAKAFTEWYVAQTEWEGSGDPCNPAITTPAVWAWFMDLIKEFPAMNGPFAKPGDEEEDDEVMTRTSEYGIAPSLIYVGFA
jgi:hypothetical protein